MTPFLGPGRRFLLNTADLGAAKPDQEAYARAHARIEQELRNVAAPRPGRLPRRLLPACGRGCPLRMAGRAPPRPARPCLSGHRGSNT